MTRKDISRRRLLQSAGATGAVALAGCLGGDGDSDGGDEGTTTDEDDSQTVRVGVFQNFDTTTNTGFGSQALSGLLSGFAYKNGQDEPISIPGDNRVLTIDGETLEYTIDSADGLDALNLEVLVRHTGRDEDEATELANELIEEDGVDILYGASSSDALRQVNNLVMRDHDIPFFVAQGSTANVTRDADACRPQVFRTPPNAAMLARAGAFYISTATDFERVSIFSADSSFGRDVRQNYLEILDNDPSVTVTVDEVVGIGFDDWDEPLERANEQSEAILYGFTGVTGEFFADALADNVFSIDVDAYGQAPSRLTYQDIGESLLDVVGSEDAITADVIDALPFGAATCRYFWHHYDNPVNRWLVDTHSDVYGVRPDLFTASGFTTASAIVQSFQQAGETGPDTVVEEVNGMAVSDTPKGDNQYLFQEFNNQAISPITIADWQPRDEANDDHWPPLIQPSEPLEVGGRNIVPKERAALPRSSVTCELS